MEMLTIINISIQKCTFEANTVIQSIQIPTVGT